MEQSRKQYQHLTAMVGGIGLFMMQTTAAIGATESIETVTVVGHKITELDAQSDAGALGKRSILETPFSVDVISLEDMEIRQVNTLDSLFSREASVSVDGSAYSTFGSTVRVRGLPLDYTNSFKINGLSVNNFSGELPYEAFEQVTLLKGAAGFMFGMGVPGGIVNYVTKTPVEDLLSIDIGARSDSVLSAHLDASTRLGDQQKYGVRLNLVKEEGDSYLENGKIDRKTAAIAFDAELSNSLTWQVDLIHNDRRTENSWTTMSNSMASEDSLPKSVDGSRSIAVDGTFDDDKNLVALTSLNWEINDHWNARLEYDYSKNETRWVKTLAYLVNSQGDINISLYDQYFDVSYRQYQGLVNGIVETGPITHELVVGFSEQKATTYRNDPDRLVTSGYGVDNLYRDVDLPTYHSTLPNRLAMAWSDRQTSVFVSDTLSVNEQWDIMLGLRSTDIEHTPSSYFSSFHSDYDDSATSPTAAVIYKPAEQMSVYASYVESFEGAISTVGETYANADELLPPLETKQYEAGIKAAGLGWSATAAWFRIERGAEIATPDNYLVQDGEEIYQGLEVSAALTLTQNFSVYGEVMWLDSQYEKTNDATEGNDVAGAPDQQFSLQSNYDVAALPGLSINVGGKFHGRATLDAANTWELPSYTVFYGGLSYQTQWRNQQLTLIGTVDNLFDKSYWAVSDSYGGLRIGEPRTAALKLKVDF